MLWGQDKSCIFYHVLKTAYTSAAVIVLTPAKTFFLCPTGVLVSSVDCEKHDDMHEGAVIGRRTGLLSSSGPVCVNMGILLMRFRAMRKHNRFNKCSRIEASYT